MPGRRWFILGALFGALAVGFGAFGAHGLEDGGIQKLYEKKEDQEKHLGQWKTGVQYHAYHVAPLLILGLMPAGDRPRLRAVAGWLFVAGLLGFSFGLYVLALTDIKLLGASIVPLGGTCWIAAWVCLALSTSFGRGAVQQ